MPSSSNFGVNTRTSRSFFRIPDHFFLCFLEYALDVISTDLRVFNKAKFRINRLKNKTVPYRRVSLLLRMLHNSHSARGNQARRVKAFIHRRGKTAGQAATLTAVLPFSNPSGEKNATRGEEPSTNS